MSLTIANNVSSLTAQHNVGRSNVALRRSLERLSSGLKINRGADGPAALVISEKQRTQISGLRQAIANTEKAVSLIQTAEGGLNEINSLLIKIRSLALDSANTGVNDDEALAANQEEVNNALDTINRIANNTQFGTKKLLDGSAGISGIPSDPNMMTFLRATNDTVEGSYEVIVTTEGERAIVTAAAQANPLGQDEIVTINGVNVTLFAGMTQAEVIDRINEFTAQTGVIADDNGAGGETRIYSTVWGTQGAINVISNQAPAADTSWIRQHAATDGLRSGRRGHDWRYGLHGPRQCGDRQYGSDQRPESGDCRRWSGPDHNRRCRFDGHDDGHRRFPGVPDRTEPESDRSDRSAAGPLAVVGNRRDEQSVRQSQRNQCLELVRGE